MTATCTCPPDDCHGGHTIQIYDGPPVVCLPVSELEALRARVAELEAADREHTQLIEFLHYAHGIEIDREHDDFREWQEQYGQPEPEGDGGCKPAPLPPDIAAAKVHIAELEAAQREPTARCQATTVDPSRPDRPSCAWCVLPAGHQGMHRAELPQDHFAPATLEWPNEVTE